MDAQRTTTYKTDVELIRSLNEKQRREHYLIKHYSDVYDRVMEYGKIHNIESFTKILYHYCNNIKDSILCKICNKVTKFRGFNQGYNTFCSNKCVMSDKSIVESRNRKSIETCLNKYGVNNVAKLDSVKNKIKNTCKDKYGVDNYTKTEEYKSRMITHNNEVYGVDWYQQSSDFIEKSKNKCMNKYGTIHHTKSNQYKDSIKQSNINKWGVDNYSKTKNFKLKMNDYYLSNDFLNNIEKQISTNKLKLIDYYSSYNDNYEFISINNDDILLKCKSCIGEFYINKQLYYLRTKRNMTCCTICNPKNGKNISYAEKEVFEYISSIYIGTIIENHKEDRMELDIYLPELNIGFEYNGLWFHSEFNRETNYHLSKLNHFNKLGIDVFTIWEDDWEYRKDIVKSMISNRLSVNTNKIMSRKCVIREVDNSISNTFLDDNHIQGKSKSLVKLGLYYEGELVSIMTFGNLRKSLGLNSKKGSWELIRFCNKINTTVVGSASKLLKHFIKSYSPEYILSYADKSRSNGNLYNVLGFNNVGDTKPNYFWCKNGLRHNRFSFRKDILVKKGHDINSTETEIMHSLKYYKVYNCGNIKFEMILKKYI